MFNCNKKTHCVMKGTFNCDKFICPMIINELLNGAAHLYVIQR